MVKGERRPEACLDGKWDKMSMKGLEDKQSATTAGRECQKRIMGPCLQNLPCSKTDNKSFRFGEWESSRES